YRLSFGRDVELVCIDTSQDEENEDVHRYFQDSEHRAWLEHVFQRPDVKWRIPFSHHPCFCAGPAHHDDEEMIRDLVPLFQRGGVRLALAGHEHNFQISEVDDVTYVVSGAGGKVREEVPERLADAGTIAWTGQSHLLHVNVEGQEISLTPFAALDGDGRPHRMTALNRDNEVVYPPFALSAKDSTRGV
ncbi:MAG TPA: metallophosphoesterase, partial [Actinomycetes bacterium]|nr:metallophosphoesterase [Actinomycetes bacterium]